MPKNKGLFKDPPNNYTRIFNEINFVVFDPYEFRILVYLLSCKQEFTPSIPVISRVTKIGITKVKGTLESLAKKNVIDKRTKTADCRQTYNDYYLKHERFWKVELNEYATIGHIKIFKKAKLTPTQEAIKLGTPSL